MSGSTFDFSDDDLSALLDCGSVEVVASDDEDASPELQRLSRRISGQYVDVLASFAGQAFAGRTTRSARHQVLAALDALKRLAEASRDLELVAALAELDALLPASERRGKRSRQRFLNDMRAWVLRFADLLPVEDADRMRDLVSFDGKSLPLLDELASLSGIGPKRLQRLYCAGLFTVEAVCAADPHDISLVTGLPGPLAVEVVTATRRFAEDQRRRCIEELGRHATQLKDTLRNLELSDAEQRQLLELARAAMEQLHDALGTLDPVLSKEDT